MASRLEPFLIAAAIKSLGMVFPNEKRTQK